jgi:hypothetical protein
MKTNGIVAAVAVSSALSLGAALATAPADADEVADLISGPTTDHNPLRDYAGYCTWGAQELIHDHTGYYIKALTGEAGNWANQAEAAGWTVVGDAQPHSIAVFSSALAGGVGHVARGHRRQRIPHYGLRRIRHTHRRGSPGDALHPDPLRYDLMSSQIAERMKASSSAV